MVSQILVLFQALSNTICCAFFIAVGRQSLSWHTMECCLFLLDIHLDLECSRWTPLGGELHMVQECLLAMAQENQVKQSWHLQSIRASIWLSQSSGSTSPDGVFLISFYSCWSSVFFFLPFFVVKLVVAFYHCIVTKNYSSVPHCQF